VNIAAVRIVSNATAPAPYRRRCLGNFHLNHFSDDVTPQGRKARALISLLALTGESVRRERLAGLLWSERDDGQSRASLRTLLYDMRALFGGAAPLLESDRASVDLVRTRIVTDLALVDGSIAAANFEAAESALSGWSGTLFADLDSTDPAFDEWLAAERAFRHERLVSSLVRALDRALCTDVSPAIRAIITKLAQVEPLNEIVLRLTLRADHAVADVSAIHRRYTRFRALLRAELGAQPSPATQALYAALTG